MSKEKMAQYQPLTRELEKELDKRVENNYQIPATIMRDLGRYYALIEEKRRELAAIFSIDEGRAIKGAFLGIGGELDAYAIRTLPAEVSDFIANGNCEPLGIAGGELFRKICDLDYLGLVCLADAVERYCLAESQGRRPEWLLAD